jgi:hypothetical protein
MFVVTKGKLLGHVILERGISIDHECIEAISKIGFLASQKELKSFLGKINFVRKFITRFAEILRPLNDMLKKEAIDWTTTARKAFEEINEAIMDAPILLSPDYTKPFYIYPFASKHTCIAILTQKIDDQDEHPIAFMSSPLKDAKLRYPNVKKQAYTLVKEIKKFQHYILRSKVYAIVPDATVKTLLMRNELGERRGKWMVVIQEYDMEIQPMKLV